LRLDIGFYTGKIGGLSDERERFIARIKELENTIFENDLRHKKVLYIILEYILGIIENLLPHNRKQN
jgi:hypothetical protein